jgi:CheY-like chemotaxis protein
MSAPAHALVVEDLDFWQDTLQEVLIDGGYHVWTASSYAEALDTLAGHAFQLAVIDPVLDDTDRHNRDGLQVLRYILDQRPDMRAVVVTSSDPKHIQREVNEMCADVPVLCKDEWDDNRFLAIVRDF